MSEKDTQVLKLSVQAIGRMTPEEINLVLDACKISPRDFAMKLWNQIHERQFLVENLDGVLNTAIKNGDKIAEEEARTYLAEFGPELEILRNIYPSFEDHLRRPEFRASKSAATLLIEKFNRSHKKSI